MKAPASSAPSLELLSCSPSTISSSVAQQQVDALECWWLHATMRKHLDPASTCLPACVREPPRYATVTALRRKTAGLVHAGSCDAPQHVAAGSDRRGRSAGRSGCR